MYHFLQMGSRQAIVAISTDQAASFTAVATVPASCRDRVELAGSAGVDAGSVTFDDDGSIVYGGGGPGLRRTTPP